MVFFIILCIFLALFVLIQQGKGDLGFGSMAGGQMLFGGSGGQGFFEKTTWILGALFILGALGLSILKSKELRTSILDGAPVATKIQAPRPMKQKATNATDAASKQARNTQTKQLDTITT